MSELLYRKADTADIPAMAQIRAGDWGTADFWQERIRAYLTHEHSPQHGLQPRVSYVCAEDDLIVGLIAGHLTRRFACDGELQWISVLPLYRGRGIASELFRLLSEWFLKQNARRICVDVEPGNEMARRFYQRHGAHDLKPSWMVWSDLREAHRTSS